MIVTATRSMALGMERRVGHMEHIPRKANGVDAAYCHGSHCSVDDADSKPIARSRWQNDGGRMILLCLIDGTQIGEGLLTPPSQRRPAVVRLTT